MHCWSLLGLRPAKMRCAGPCEAYFYNISKLASWMQRDVELK